MRRQYRKPYTRIISLIAATACLIAPVSGCGQAEEEETMSEVIPVQVQQPEAGSLTLKNEFVGTVSPEEAVYVISMVSAEVVNTNVSVGDVVSAGDVLCELDSEAAQLQLASAQVQYESATAGASAAQIGYEAAQYQYAMAQSQYESTVAQLDAQMWGQKNLQLYQLQMQVDSVEAGINDIYEQQAKLNEQKKDAEEQRDNLKGAVEQANSYLAKAQQDYYAAVAYVSFLEPGSYGDLQTVIAMIAAENGIPMENTQAAQAAYEYTLEQAKNQLEMTKSAYEQASAAASQASAAYTQLEAGIESMDDGQEQLEDALSDAYKGLEQAQTIMNITQDQVYADTQKIVDANKETAALSLDSASLGIDSAAAQVSSAQIGVEGAQIAIDSAQYQLDMYTLKAPISGVIEAVNVQEHGFASPSNPAFIISNKDTMTVTFYVSEGIRNTLKVGQQVSVDRNGKLYDAAITEIGSMIDQTTGLFAVKTCVSSPDESLLTGCSVKVTADTYSQDGVLLIPYDAVYYDDSQPYVYVAVDGVVERRDIETGIFDAETITVLSGLTTQDQLITSWSANLREGALISIQSQQNSNTAGSGE